VCNRWREQAGLLRKLQGANLRLFLSAGWLLTRSWQTCSNEAEVAMIYGTADYERQLSPVVREVLPTGVAGGAAYSIVPR